MYRFYGRGNTARFIVINHYQEDVRRQALNVFRMKLLGAEVISVEIGIYLAGFS